MKTHRILDWPSIPQTLLDFDLADLEPMGDNKSYNSQYTVTKHDQAVPGARFDYYHLPEALRQWLIDHIDQQLQQSCLALTTGACEHLPHRDVSAGFKINYLLATGGDRVTTSFYRYRDQHMDPKTPGVRPAKFEDLELIDQFTLEPGQWVAIDVGILHGVSGITGVRQNISLMYDRPPLHLEW